MKAQGTSTLKSILALTLLISLALSQFGCSSRPTPHTSSLPQKQIDMDPLLIKQGASQTWSADELFEHGVGAFQGQDFQICVDKLTLFFEATSDSKSDLKAS